LDPKHIYKWLTTAKIMKREREREGGEGVVAKHFGVPQQPGRYPNKVKVAIKIRNFLGVGARLESEKRHGKCVRATTKWLHACSVEFH
jgi:hypothetical protein